MPGLYNESMVKQHMVQALRDAPRGTKSKLARDVGVEPATVTKWANGHTCPDPDKWPAIETSLGMNAGDLRVAGGLPRNGVLPHETPDGRLLVEHTPGDGTLDVQGYFSWDEVALLLVSRGLSKEEAEQAMRDLREA